MAMAIGWLLSCRRKIGERVGNIHGEKRKWTIEIIVKMFKVIDITHMS